MVPGSRLLVAVSGGADSVALLHALRSQPYRLFVGHVDHQLRKNSHRDARFVQALADQWDIPCRIVKVDVKARKKQHDETWEEAARYLRYNALQHLAQRWKCQAVVTAHTADDQIETILMNVFRGAGPAGLSGMPENRPLHARSAIRLWRPLLQTRRTELRNYLSQHKLKWKEDASNKNQHFTRNYLRLSVLPLLERRFPGIGARLLKMAKIFREMK